MSLVGWYGQATARDAAGQLAQVSEDHVRGLDGRWRKRLPAHTRPNCYARGA